MTNKNCKSCFICSLPSKCPHKIFEIFCSETASEEDNKDTSIKASSKSTDLYLPSATKSSDAFVCSSSSTAKKRGKQD